jgi:hypothetical protein
MHSTDKPHPEQRRSRQLQFLINHFSSAVAERRSQEELDKFIKDAKGLFPENPSINKQEVDRRINALFDVVFAVMHITHTIDEREDSGSVSIATYENAIPGRELSNDIQIHDLFTKFSNPNNFSNGNAFNDPVIDYPILFHPVPEEDYITDPLLLYAGIALVVCEPSMHYDTFGDLPGMAIKENAVKQSIRFLVFGLNDDQNKSLYGVAFDPSKIIRLFMTYDYVHGRYTTGLQDNI